MILNGGEYNGNSNGCIYAYNHHSSLIEFNQLNNAYGAVYIKDTTNDIPIDELLTTVRFNEINNSKLGLYFQAGGQATHNAAIAQVNNNIFNNVAGLVSATNDLEAIRLYSYNNFIDYRTFGPAGDTYASGGFSATPVAGTPTKRLKSVGNIYSDSNVTGSEGVNYAFNDSDVTLMDFAECDYNLYEAGPAVSFQYAAAITDIAVWRVTTNGRMSAVNPDLNGLANQALSTLATASGTDYTIPAGSPAEAMMADGSNVGPYQFGNTTPIGVIS